MRVAVACSGGADSVALLRTLLYRQDDLGIVVSVAHLNHGIRGSESDADQAFVEALATEFSLEAHTRLVDTPARARSSREGLEEAARNLRYAWFWDLLAQNRADAVITAHTLDDQSETVLHRLIRGAWTEGLSGIHPILHPAPRQPGVIFRPFLSTTRREIETFLREIGQTWREDASNRDIVFTRNRLRHELLPALAAYNPAIAKQFAQMASLAREEEAYWQAELDRLLPSLLLPGRAVRGGGRATGTLAGNASLSIEIERLRPLLPAVRRRVLRAAAGRLGVSLDFESTERLLSLCGFVSGEKPVRPGLKLQFDKGLLAERTPRELKISRADSSLEEGLRVAGKSQSPGLAEYLLPIPGTVDAPAFNLRLHAALGSHPVSPLPQAPFPEARLRRFRPADRVTLRHSRSVLKIKDALQRSRLPVTPGHPVLEWQGEIVWVLGLVIESTLASTNVLEITSVPLHADIRPLSPVHQV